MQGTHCPECTPGPPRSDAPVGIFSRPGYLLLIVASAIVAGESMIMLFLHRLRVLAPFQAGIVDSILLTISVFPVLFIFVFRPMRTHIDRRRRIEREKDVLIVELQNALAEVKTLQGIIPICSSCKKIRDDKGYWKAVEEYLGSHTEIEFSHGICPECARRHYAEYL